MFAGIRVVLSVFLIAVPIAASCQALSVSPAGRYLLEPDGQAFTWIGDTAWELFHKLDREETLHYLDDRAGKGFTLIQAVLLAELDGLRTPNALGDLPLHDLDPTQPNEAYFAHVDWVIDEAAKRGLYMGLLPTWGDKVPSNNPGAGPVVFNPANAAVYGAFLGERYRDARVVWILGGDRNVDSEEARNTWDAMGNAIRQATDGRQLITFHPRGGHTSAQWFADAPWLDFHMYQIGHEPRTSNLHRLLDKSRNARPVKPVVDGEPAYEDIASRFWEYMDFSSSQRVPAGVLDENGFIARPEHFADGFISAHDVRIHAYWDFLGGAAGYTYGHNAVWQMFKVGDTPAIPAFRTWREALQRPAASQLQHLAGLWESRSLASLQPGGSFVSQAPEHAAWAAAGDGAWAMVYLPDGGEVVLDLHALAGSSYRASWMNPVSGEWLNADMGEPGADNLIFKLRSPPMDAPDRVLVLDMKIPE